MGQLATRTEIGQSRVGHSILKVVGPPLRTGEAALFPDRVPEMPVEPTSPGRVEMHPYPTRHVTGMHVTGMD